MKIKVSVNGYGTIGKRIADAIMKQPDMELVGVSKLNADYEAAMAVRKGIKLYIDESSKENFKKAGIEVAGTKVEMINDSHIVIDATPDGIGAKNKALYVSMKKPAIFQGGEDADVAEASFSALCNYDEVKGKNYVRVVSCNTTGMLRVICALKNSFKVRKVRVVLIRRAADPREVKKGPINSILLNPVELPSHHAVDVKTVLKDLDILTMAYVVPTTLMHVHALMVQVDGNPNREEIINVLESSRRILGVSKESKIASTAEIVEAFRDIGRIRYDVPEVVFFEDSVHSSNGEIFLTYAVHQESIVVPENIDAIRAMFGLKEKEESISLTDSTLGLLRGRLV
ncbi:MAG: type II glyceraldehyde-3-phosphate dehydrogenase [Thaumarchaeota archaeon]|jgi:glyceraldehyde-3-phosphate dehydrogenase (NAD(P))|nr:type II glyceraldehyde-3-phosphate dehydrogenase [Nitrososphaerota archaeon]